MQAPMVNPNNRIQAPIVNPNNRMQAPMVNPNNQMQAPMVNVGAYFQQANAIANQGNFFVQAIPQMAPQVPVYARNNNANRSRIVNPQVIGEVVLGEDLKIHIRTQQEKKRRINYNWVNKDDIIDELICEHCKRYYFNPMKISCGDTLCQTCVEELKKSKDNCPICDKKIDHRLTGKDVMTVWTLEEMQVYCSNKNEKECDWKGLIKELDDH